MTLKLFVWAICFFSSLLLSLSCIFSSFYKYGFDAGMICISSMGFYFMSESLQKAISIRSNLERFPRFKDFIPS